MRFAVSYNRFNRVLMTVLGGGPRWTHVDVDPFEVTVQMGIWFSTVIPRANISTGALTPARILSAGVHGWKGRWLVNGSSHGLVTIAIEPPVRARVTGVRVKLRQLTISLEDPDGFLAAIASPPPQ